MVKDLSNLEGKIVVFGGPYSNLHALKRIKEKVEELDVQPTNVICTGDIVAYCAYPDECIQLIKNWGIHCIAGNVELNLRDGEMDCGCNFNEGGRCDAYSKRWFPFVQKHVSEASIRYINTLPEFISFNYNGRLHFVLHGSYFNTSQFIFKSTSWAVKTDNFKATGADVIISGHCGIPFIDQKDDKTWLNAGVIGMPANDGNASTWYCIIDDDNYHFERLLYDHESASSHLLDQKDLPFPYGKTLKDGIWDNCDILPDLESQNQGMALNFDRKVIQ